MHERSKCLIAGVLENTLISPELKNSGMADNVLRTGALQIIVLQSYNLHSGGN